MQKHALSLMLLALAGCSAASGPTASFAPEQCIRYLECPEGMTDCHGDARGMCPAGYSVLNEAALGAEFASFAQSHFAGAGVTHMVIACNP